MMKHGSVARNGGGNGSWNHVPITPGPVVSTFQSREARSTLSMPACLQAALIPLDREDAPAAQLTLKGGLVLGGLGAELIFNRARDNGPRGRTEVTTKAILVPTGECLEFERRRFRSGVGGLGRLGQGYRPMDPSFTALVDAETFISPIACATQLDSDLTLRGEMTFLRGVSARVVLRRRGGSLWWSRPAAAVFDLDIVKPGQRILFPTQPIWAGDHGGALRSLLFLNGEGEPIGEEHLLEPAISTQ